MSTSCIQVTSLPFPIEATNRNGLTSPNCTSKQSVWTFPADKTAVQPKQISEMVWKASKLNQGSCMHERFCRFSSQEHSQAQLVEHRTGIAEVTGLNPVDALIFFQASSFQLLKLENLLQ